MATQTHAPLAPGFHRYRRVAKFPIIGANVSGKVSVASGDNDMLILGTIAAFGPTGYPSLTTNFGPLIPIAGGGNVIFPTAPTNAMPTAAATVNGAPMGSTLHNSVNGVATGVTPATSTGSTLSTNTGISTGPINPTASTVPTASGASNTIGFNSPPLTNPAQSNHGLTLVNPPASTDPTAQTANGASNAIVSHYNPMAILSNHGLPYELTDLLVSFKEFKAIFKCIRDLRYNRFIQLAIVSINPEMRDALLIPAESEIAYPNAHLAGLLAFEKDEALCFEITWIADHRIDFMIKATTSQTMLW